MEGISRRKGLMNLTVKSLVILLALTSVFTVKADTNGPSLSCDSPIFDFGTRLNTEEIQHSFTFTNISSAPLVITRVRSGCGCTRAELDRSTIPPGETAVLSSRLTLTGFFGVKRSTIYLHTNDPAHPVFLCQYQGTVLSEMDVTPPAVHFYVKPASTNQDSIVIIQNRTAIPLHPLSIETPGNYCSVMLHTNEPGQQYSLTVTCVATAAVESVKGVITLLTDHPRFSRITVPLSISRVLK